MKTIGTHRLMGVRGRKRTASTGCYAAAPGEAVRKISGLPSAAGTTPQAGAKTPDFVSSGHLLPESCGGDGRQARCVEAETVGFGRWRGWQFCARRGSQGCRRRRFDRRWWRATPPAGTRRKVVCVTRAAPADYRKLCRVSYCSGHEQPAGGESTMREYRRSHLIRWLESPRPRTGHSMSWFSEIFRRCALAVGGDRRSPHHSRERCWSGNPRSARCCRDHRKHGLPGQGCFRRHVCASRRGSVQALRPGHTRIRSEECNRTS